MSAIRNYTYGLLEPILNGDLVDQQIVLAHRYYNNLVEMERARRDQVRAVMSAHPDLQEISQRVADLVAQRDAARQVILDTRKASRHRSESQVQREAVRALTPLLRDARALLATRKAAVMSDPDLLRSLAQAQDVADQKKKDLRAVCGVYWGTYLLIESAFDAARKNSAPPEFKPFRQHGRVSVQLQGGLEAKDVWGADTQLQIRCVDKRPPGSSRNAGTACVLRMRVQSDGRKPIWAEWPLKLHRPLRDGAVVKVATVSRKIRGIHGARTGTKMYDWEWMLCVTVDESACGPRRAVPADGAVALNLGYCQRPNEAIRSGYLVGSDGYEEEVLVTRRTIDGVGKASSITEFRDRDVNAIRAAMQGHRSFLPEKVRETIHAWKSPHAFHRLHHLLRTTERVEGDEPMYQVLEAWRYRDVHLERYQTGARRGALNYRRDSYKKLAARMAARYRYLIVDDTGLSELQRSPDPESAEVQFDAVKRQMRLAAGSELRGKLESAFGPDRTIVRSAAHVTEVCSGCLRMNQWDRSASWERNRRCLACGRERDQDANACENHLRDWPIARKEWEAARAAKLAVRKPSRSERMLRNKVARTEATTGEP